MPVITAATLDLSGDLLAVNIRAGAANAIYWNGRVHIRSPSDGVLTLMDTAEADFYRLQFGGTTSSFPALRRNATQISCVLADESAYAPLGGRLLSVGAPVTAGASEVGYGGTTQATIGANGAASALTANPVGYIIVNVAGTNRIIPYYNA